MVTKKNKSGKQESNRAGKLFAEKEMIELLDNNSKRLTNMIDKKDRKKKSKRNL